MRIFTTILFIGLITCSGYTFSQIAAWDFTGDNNGSATSAADVYNANMDASSNLTRGAGAPASTGGNSFRTTGFSNNGIALTNTDYFQFTLSASTGYKLSLSTIDAKFRGTATFSAGPGGVTNQFAYSLDGTTFTLISPSSVIVGDVQGIGELVQINLSGITALQDLPAATTVTFRYYASGQTNTGGWGFYSATPGSYGLAIGGTVVSTTIPCPTLTAPVAPAVSVCSGSTATLAATGSQQASILTWYDVATDGTSLHNGASYTTSALTTATSFWVQDSVTGCPASPRTEVPVTINALPTVNAGTDFSACIGQNITLSGSGASTYAWDNSVINGTPFAINATTTYTVTGTDTHGCIDTDEITVTVSGTAPTVDAGADQTICAGASTSLTATGTGIFTWDNGVSQAVPFTPTATTTYTVTVDNGVCTNTDEVTITVNQPSVAGTISVSDLDACLNDVITGTITGNTGSVEWFIQAGVFPYTSAGTTTTLSLTPPAAATYMVKAEVKNGVCPLVTTNILTVVVNALPTVTAGADQAVCPGTPVTLNGGGAATYTWNNNVVNATAFTPTATATYTVTGTDSHGCINTDAVIVTVNALPAVNAGADQAVCAGSPVTLTGSPATGITYVWSGNVTNGTAFTPTATATYTATGTDANGCVNTDQVVVTVNPLPVVTTTVSNHTTITAAPAGLNYQWINCGTTQPITGATNAAYTATANGTYSVKVTDNNGCTATSSCVTINQVGIEDVKADSGISFYPNPTKGKVTLTMSATDQATVTVYNALGKVVYTANNAQNGTVIDLSANQAGVYMIQISAEKGSNIFRIVKN